MPDVASPPVPKVAAKPARPKAPDQGAKRAAARAKPKAPPAIAPYVSPFAIGDQISHPQFGEGTVTAIDAAKLTIDFASRGTKQILDDYVKPGKSA